MLSEEQWMQCQRYMAISFIGGFVTSLLIIKVALVLWK
jgi:hypothetical protein